MLCGKPALVTASGNLSPSPWLSLHVAMEMGSWLSRKTKGRDPRFQEFARVGMSENERARSVAGAQVCLCWERESPQGGDETDKIGGRVLKLPW